jgi:hypothetical protein
MDPSNGWVKGLQVARADFYLLSDDEIRNAIDVAAVALSSRLWPKALAKAPELKSQEDAFFELCKLTLAKRHGVQELFQEGGN